MAQRVAVEVRCFGDQAIDGNPAVKGHPYGDPLLSASPAKARRALEALLTCLRFNAGPPVADVVHCHTWYSHFGGLLAKMVYGLPLVITVHSLEPLRPWKREQLGGGYDLAIWVERQTLEAADAVITVSEHDRLEVLRHYRVAPERVRTIPNGVDTDLYRRVGTRETLQTYGIPEGMPYALFLGRITRQKGFLHFVRAAEDFRPELGVVLCAAKPDEPRVAQEVGEAIDQLVRRRGNVTWIREMVTPREAVELYSHAAVYCCPSIYEPFGIVNLEAMACETPVVASAVGGIPEVVEDGLTGFLVPFDSSADGEPAQPDRFARDLAERVNRLATDPSLRQAMGLRGRERALRFDWPRVTERVLELYRELLNSRQEDV
jgi:glycogen synthase